MGNCNGRGCKNAGNRKNLDMICFNWVVDI